MINESRVWQFCIDLGFLIASCRKIITYIIHGLPVFALYQSQPLRLNTTKASLNLFYYCAYDDKTKHDVCVDFITCFLSGNGCKVSALIYRKTIIKYLSSSSPHRGEKRIIERDI